MGSVSSPLIVSAEQAPSALDGIAYRDSRHAGLPHVVKFSGGRSSAALVFSLAEAGALRPERGDVVLFANTSAEHPGTWEFAAECWTAQRGRGTTGITAARRILRPTI